MTTAVEHIKKDIARLDEMIAREQQHIESRLEDNKGSVAAITEWGTLRAGLADLLPPEEPDVCPHRGIIADCMQCEAEASGE